MIRVQIDVWPYGDKKNKRGISTINIANEHTNKVTQDALYRCTVFDEGDQTEYEVTVNHNIKDGIYVLLQKVLEEYTEIFN